MYFNREEPPSGSVNKPLLWLVVVVVVVVVLEDRQEHSVPQSLVILITVIMYERSIKDKTSYLLQSALSPLQLIMFNSCVRRRHQPSSHT